MYNVFIMSLDTLISVGLMTEKSLFSTMLEIKVDHMAINKQ